MRELESKLNLILMYTNSARSGDLKQRVLTKSVTVKVGKDRKNFKTCSTYLFQHTLPWDNFLM